MTKLRAQILFSVFFLFFCFDNYQIQFFQLPYGIHEWSNGERLSLAFGFYDNGMNFWRPTTFNQESLEAVVGHEFPIQSYWAALMGKLLGREYITSSFRAINILCFWAGLLSLFTLVFQRTKSFLFALIPPALMVSSPMFVDYAGGFLPDPAAASIVFVGFYFLFGLVHQFTKRRMVGVILLLTLATLIKTSAIIYLAAVLVYLLVYHLRQRKTVDSWLLFIGLSVFSGAAILGFYLHNDYLNTHYHATLFPTKPMPFKGIDDLSQYFSYSFKHNWMSDYFVLPAYLLFVLAFGASWPVVTKEKAYKPYALLAVLFFVCLLPVFWIMGNQLHIHDYYTLCMFFPLIAYLFTLSIIVIHQKLAHSPHFSMVRSAVVFTLLLLYCFSNFGIYKRLNINDSRIMQWTRVPWMKEGAKILDGLKIPLTEKIVILNEMPPNQGLLYFNRNGLVFYHDRWNDSNSSNVVDFMREKKMQIAVCDSKRVLETEQVNPKFFEQFETLYRDDKATVFKLR